MVTPAFLLPQSAIFVPKSRHISAEFSPHFAQKLSGLHHSGPPLCDLLPMTLFMDS